MSALGNWLLYAVHGAKAVRRPRRRRRGPARSYKYKAWIRTLPCLVCGAQPSEAAHTGSDGGMSMRSSDYSCLPLCSEHHTMAPASYHQIGRARFEALHDIDCRAIVKRLTHDWFAYSGEIK